MVGYLPDIIGHYRVLYSQRISIVATVTGEKFADGEETYLLCPCVFLGFYICICIRTQSTRYIYKGSIK